MPFYLLPIFCLWPPLNDRIFSVKEIFDLLVMLSNCEFLI